MKPFQVTTGVYSKSEMPLINFINKIKGKIFYPVLYICTALKIRPSAISVISAAIAFCSLILAVYKTSPIYFIYGIWLHLIFDGIDGSLARFQKKQTYSGALLDALCDHVGIISSSIFMINFSYAAKETTIVFAIFYTLLIVISFLLNYFNKPFRYALRPRIIVFISFTIDYFYKTAFTDKLLIIISAIMIFSSAIGIYKIYKHLRGSRKI